MREMQSELFSQNSVIGDIERQLKSRYRFAIGLDEAGRGPLAGPVYAAAVLVDLEDLDVDWLAGIDDSKKLSESARQAAHATLVESEARFHVASRDAAAIDELNILQASLRSMEDALSMVAEELEDVVVLVDGNQRVLTDLPQITLVKGDSRSLAIAAASVLAKVGRDQEMTEHHLSWPEYGFDRHKGYPSKAHRQAIAEHGPCAIHRLTFAGVKEHADRLRA
ncbi:MAG: ribonuclease HII [bacterium]